jgi:hypothetical protein
VSIEYTQGNQGKEGGRIYGRKMEEYAADICLVARRTLDEDDHRIFRFYFLLGADWKLCCGRLSLDRGSFFHKVYSVEEKLGRAFAELEPYPLYPLDDYFAGMIRREPRLQPASEIRVTPGWGARAPLPA